MAFLPFHIAEIWKRCPFRVKPPRIGFYGVSPGGKFSFSDQNSVSKTYGGPFFLGGSIMGFPLRTWRTFFTYSSTSPLGTPVSSRAATHINVLCIMALLALSLASLGANIICASRLTSSASITAWTWQDKFAHQRHTRNKWTARLSPSPSPPLFSPRNDVWGTRGEFLYWWRRASDWLTQISLAALPIKKNYPDLGSDASSLWNFSARFSFPGKTSTGIAKCWLHSRATGTRALIGREECLHESM